MENRATTTGRSEATPVAHAIIIVVLLAHAIVPLRYYVGGSAPDERFCWRMFSSLRMRTCDVRLSETTLEGDRRRTRVVPLRQTVGRSWLGLLTGNQPDVVDRLMARRCLHPGVVEVIWDCRCTGADGKPLPPTHRVVNCADGDP